jgi:hypothetical protein
MDWFEKLTGFREADYNETRAKLKVEGRQLQSLVNGKSYGIGELELLSLQDLRERVKSSDGLAGRLKASVVTGDVRQMHRLPENAGALFQVASQFNMLEMTGPGVTPENGVTIYQHDHTQGPACAIAAGAATIYRNYFAPVGGSYEQAADRQLDGLADLGEALSEALKQPRRVLMADAQRLCIVQQLGARRHLGAPRAAATRSGGRSARQASYRDPQQCRGHRRRRGTAAGCLASLLLRPSGGLQPCTVGALETIRVSGFGGCLRSYDVSGCSK